MTSCCVVNATVILKFNTAANIATASATSTASSTASSKTTTAIQSYEAPSADAIRFVSVRFTK